MKSWALVTGGSRGIGAAIAESLAAAGHPVILNYRTRADAAREVAARIAQAGGRAELAPFDVSDSAATDTAIAALLADGRQIGIVVNNAGIVKDMIFPRLRLADWTQVTRTTLDGFYNVTHPLIMPMMRERWGRIVNIASVSGVMGNAGQVNYSAAKAGLIGATRALAQELARCGITVNAVAPGLIETEMIAGAPIEALLARIPMRRLGRPEEVAKLVTFLASADADYITGQVIGINGGLA